jgi:hypothetical protein
MSLRRMRLGEALALVGAILVIVSTFVASYEGPEGTLDAWDTFGGAVILELAAVSAALAMVFSALTERSTALPVSTGVWCVPLGLIGTIAALVRVFERPDGASMTCIGVWLALAGTLAILLGAWRSIGDERPSLYQPARPKPRPRP